jgi:hypothetical protein
MSRVDLHPEELFDRARRGEASAPEIDRLRAHTEICRACRFEHTLSTDCAEGAAELPGDQLVLARVRHATMQALEVRASRSPRFARTSPARMALFAAVAVVILVAVTATGATLAQRAWRFVFRRNVAVPSAALVEAPRPKAPVAVAPVERIDEVEPTPAPAEVERRVVRAAPTIERAKPVEASSAAELFTRANRARRSGDAVEAVRIYRELQATYPGSAEELLSRVVIGRLLLDRLGDARGALAQFDSYLANPGRAELREEAFIGRALALGRLRRYGEEKSAWSALLSGYPHSAYAERARARVAELP